MIAFDLNEYNRAAKTGEKNVAPGTSYFGWYEMVMSHFIHSTGTAHLLWAHLFDKRKQNEKQMQDICKSCNLKVKISHSGQTCVP